MNTGDNADCTHAEKSRPLPALRADTLARIRAAAAVYDIGIACSGGADSVCLLHCLVATLPELRKRFLVLHFDHRIRGAESAADADFVHNLAASLDLSCICGSWEASTPDASEEEARRARMDFLHAHAQVICFGHNRDDVAESLLLRLGRGAGLDGLTGPRPVQSFRNSPLLHLRPLLDVPSAEIRTYLRASGIQWREDSTNAGTAYARNRLRHEVLPILERALGRDWAAGAARSRILMEEADELVEAAAQAFLTGQGRDTLDATALAALPRATARRALETWLSSLGLRERFGSHNVERLLAAMRDGAEALWLPQLGLILSACTLRPFHANELRPPFSVSLSAAAACTVCLPGGASLELSPIRFQPGEASLCIEKLRRARDADCAVLAIGRDNRLHLRQRLPGDSYRQMGGSGETKLQDAFVNRKIPLAERDLLPIVLVNGDIAWAPGLVPAQEFTLKSDTVDALRMRYRRNN